MAKIEQYSRLINHAISTNGSIFTVPTSNDHTDETWLATDLYIGEIGVNVTDDKVYVRTNNGIIPLATGTSSATSSTSASASPWTFNSPNLSIGSTYSADAVTPRSGYYTDLGTSTLRWKDIYLGGSSVGYATINVNKGVLITETTDSILVTNGIVSNNSPIEIYGTASSYSKSRPLHLNSKSSYILGSPAQNVTIGSTNVKITGGNNNVAIGASNTTFASGLTSSTMIGYGNGKSNFYSKQVVAGETFAVRGIADDGSNQYLDSDWKTGQTKLRTSNALTNNLVTIGWYDPSNGGEVVQVKSYIVGTSISDATLVYSAEIIGVYTLTGDGSLTPTEIGTPIINEWNSFTGTPPVAEMAADGTGVRVKISGTSTDTIQWLCTYSYHRLVNIIP